MERSTGQTRKGIPAIETFQFMKCSNQVFRGGRVEIIKKDEIARPGPDHLIREMTDGLQKEMADGG